MSQTKVTDNLRDTTQLDATKITTGTIPDARIPASAVTQHVTPFDPAQLEMNMAVLAFKVASANQLAKFNMVDQVIDEYQDATGIDAGNSTNEFAGGSGTAKYYMGGTGSDPTGGNSTDTSVSGYKTHVFTGNGSLVVGSSGNVDILVVAGGGSGGHSYGGGGGAGGLIYKANHALTANTYNAVIGAGGAGQTSGGVEGNAGADSTWAINGGSTEFTAKGGGPGIVSAGDNGNGGSGGGGGHTIAGGSATQGSESGDSGTYGFGFGGGTGNASPNYNTAGGGGAGSVGANASTSESGDGGTGKDYSSIFGTNVGDSGWFASGGGGGATSDGTTVPGHASNGGGTDGSPSSGVASSAAQANTGGGSGGGYDGTGTGAGGSGVVLVRYATTTFFNQQNLTLQSTATTAESAPTSADLVVLIEDGQGTATINTDIKGYISRDGSAFSSAVTFVDEGDWGTNKRILVARNVDISGITSGTSMKYKLTTHNQSGAKETRIHATSLAWA